MAFTFKFFMVILFVIITVFLVDRYIFGRFGTAAKYDANKNARRQKVANLALEVNDLKDELQTAELVNALNSDIEQINSKLNVLSERNNNNV